MKVSGTITMITALLLLMVCPVSGQHMPGPPIPPPLPPAHLLDSLDVDAATMEALAELKTSFEQTMTEMESRLQDAEDRFHELMHAETVSKQEILDAVDQLNILRGAAFKADVQVRIAVRELLGPDIMNQLPGPRSPRDAEPDFHLPIYE